MAVVRAEGFPIINIPTDGTRLGVENLKLLVDISFETRKRIEKIVELKNASPIKRFFAGYGRLVVHVLETVLDIMQAAPLIEQEAKDLDMSEIQEMVLYIADTHGLSIDTARKAFNLFKDATLLLKDGKVTFDELKTLV